MRKILSLLILTFATTVYLQASPLAEPVIEGRWDITVMMLGKPEPSWLEVSHSGNHTLVGLFTSVSGSARPISKVNFSNGKISFAIPPQWEGGDKDLSFEGSLVNDKLSGSISTPDGKIYNYTGVRAPSLKRTAAPVWGKPIKLFNGVDLKGW
ncbi:MAG: DUF1080 domain-containing protein, partial [Chitinophagaceae bacterium]